MAEGVAGTLSRQRARQRQLLRSRWEREVAANGAPERATDDADAQEETGSGERAGRSKAEQARGTAKNVRDTVESAKKAGKFIQTVLRVINGAEIVSVWGILLAVVTMHCQLLFGNLLHGAILPAPKLDWWEIAILLILDILVAIVIGLLIAIIVILSQLNPLNIIENAAQQIGPAAQQANPGTYNPYDALGK